MGYPEILGKKTMISTHYQHNSTDLLLRKIYNSFEIFNLSSIYIKN